MRKEIASPLECFGTAQSRFRFKPSISNNIAVLSTVSASSSTTRTRNLETLCIIAMCALLKGATRAIEDDDLLFSNPERETRTRVNTNPYSLFHTARVCLHCTPFCDLQPLDVQITGGSIGSAIRVVTCLQRLTGLTNRGGRCRPACVPPLATMRTTLQVTQSIR
jgi:hypothetical protein